jgi:polyhydroxyalkanoate synthesis regulator phasin
MDEPASDDPGTEQRLSGLVERLSLAALGALALTGDRAEELADLLVERGALRRDDARELVDELGERWRGEAMRIGERAGANFSRLFRDLGLATRDEVDELELRLAQLEHRLRLLEAERAPTEPAG